LLGCPLPCARLLDGVIRTLATVSRASARTLNCLPYPSHRVAQLLRDVGHEVADEVRATTLAAGVRCNWAEMAAPRCVGLRNVGASPEPVAASAALTVDDRSLYWSRIRRVQYKRLDGSERWLGHEPWRAAAMSSSRMHEKRMAEIYVSEGARG
jgi:hypothetical protein